jgi:putative sterol carrier protein
MGAVLDQAVAELGGRMRGKRFDGTAKIVLTGEGSVMLDADGAREGDGPADVTLTATADTFAQIVAGDLDATSAFMTGRLQLDGDMGRAMALAQILG